MEDEVARLKKRLERERSARNQAEQLLEKISIELYNSNQALKILAENLENQVQERTKELEKALYNAETATRAKSLFLANMSHEIRTPLNAILGLSYLIRQDIYDPQQVGQLDKIISAAKYLLSIINDVLDLSKIEADRLELDLAPMLVNTSVSNIFGMLEERAKEKDLDLVSFIDPRLVNLPLLGDRLRIDQVLINFLSNAIKFSERGRISLRILVCSVEDDNFVLRFEVEDNGVGISLDNQKRIFDAFEQADIITARLHGGTGLGLTICRKIALMMDGDIGVNSTLGQGSTFWFTAKLKRSWENYLSQELAQTAQLQAESKILLVEDNKINQVVAKGLLSKWQLHVDVATDGLQAVQMVQANDEYQLILMDMQMPVMDGLEATRHIRQLDIGQTVPIIALTANAFAENRQACLAAGMNGFISKPVEPEKLHQELIRWLPLTSDFENKPPTTKEKSYQLLSIDTARGLSYFDGDWLEYEDMLATFVAEYRDEADKIAAMFVSGDYAAIELTAHSIKGIALMLGMEVLSDHAKTLELNCRNFTQSDSLSLAIDELRLELGQVLHEIAVLNDIRRGK
ncbi:response regulator [Methylomonas paludis]|uniref:histidine kinase n=1 Tax=Methylomonas paludis TaxID=1173101 RepID=A0A975MPX9_9GAMM|nr:response regulator [Methylomonas paludis]QWF71655.1 response regulator [Methylomonas paludis]